MGIEETKDEGGYAAGVLGCVSQGGGGQLGLGERLQVVVRHGWCCEVAEGGTGVVLAEDLDDCVR